MSQWQTERHIQDLEKQLAALQRDATKRYAWMTFSEISDIYEKANKLRKEISVLKSGLKRNER